MSDNITRMEIFCDDKNVGRIQRALMGLIIGEPKSQPVINGVVGKGGIRANTGGSAIELLAAWIKKKKHRKGAKLKLDDIRAFAKDNSLAESSSSYFAKQACKAGTLKKHGRNGSAYYEVL